MRVVQCEVRRKLTTLNKIQQFTIVLSTTCTKPYNIVLTNLRTNLAVLSHNIKIPKSSLLFSRFFLSVFILIIYISARKMIKVTLFYLI